MTKNLSLALTLAWILFCGVASAAQPRETINIPTRQQIIAEAKSEAKLSVSPGHDEATIALLAKAFQKKYPFIQTTWGIVTGVEAAQRQLFEMAAGKSNVDVFSPSTAHWSEYFKQHLFKPYDFRALVKAGSLTIPAEMVDDTGLLVWLGTNMGVISYNSKLVPAEKAPKGWESCLDPQWRGKFSVDTKPNVLAWLATRWGEEKLLSFAKKLKENDPVWSRGNVRNLTQLVSGELLMNCGMYIHEIQRLRKKDATAPLAMAVPDPFPMSSHEPEAIYARAKNPNAGLLWLEFLASREGQEIVESVEQGRGSFLVEGTLANKLAKGANVSLCAAVCRGREEKLMTLIAVEAWGLPKVGYSPGR
jgi:iron(III) transport system substrate-binding protein